ncbi:hypothetical protein niasHT_033439 [Heterodera trifolii]|uniref:TATA-box-binding protein n=1 Tax=Heterodera trifolii TaxID=157864 RepID=A0ABD2IGA2_9BILA
MPNIQNCTVTFKIIRRRLSKDEFLKIARNGANVELNTRRFHSIIMRLRYAGRTVACLIFQSGRVVLTGVRKPSFAKIVAHRVLRRIQHAYNHATNKAEKFSLINLRVVNIVCSHTFPHRIPIVHLLPVLHIRKEFFSVRYDPTIFPALRCKLSLTDNDVHATCIVYHSGKAIITGLASVEHINKAFSLLSSFITDNIE